MEEAAFDPGPSTSPDEEVVYDASHIEELTEIPSDEINVWPNGDNSQNRQRKQRSGSQVVHIINPRRMPSRQARVKNFKELVDSKTDAPVLESAVSADNVARVFISSDVPGRHLDWVLYSNTPELFAVAAHIILTEARYVKPEKICQTVPQEFTGIGTFVVEMTHLLNRHEIGIDSLGNWGVPQGSAKFFKMSQSATKAVVCASVDSLAKIHCNRYIHPGTDSRGSFIKKIYTGVSNQGVPSTHGVIVYEWEGTPHPVSVDLSTLPNPHIMKERAFGSRSWEAQRLDLTKDEMTSFRNQPIFKKATIDFESACCLLMATFAIPENRICTRVPQQFRECGTFVLDISRCGGERAIGRDGREWTKPSGSSRFFRIDHEGRAIRIDSSIQMPAPDEYDVQIILKRYETESLPGLVRKIFIAREKGEPRVNSHLAVISYLFRPVNGKTTVFNGKEVPCRKRPFTDSSDKQDDGPPRLTAVGPQEPSLLEIRKAIAQRQYENGEKLNSLLARTENLILRTEQQKGNFIDPVVSRQEWQRSRESSQGDDSRIVDIESDLNYDVSYS